MTKLGEEIGVGISSDMPASNEGSGAYKFEEDNGDDDDNGIMEFLLA